VQIDASLHEWTEGRGEDMVLKEMRLADVRTIAEANAVLERLLPEHNRRFSVKPAQTSDAHRVLGKQHDLAAILSEQEARVVSNAYTIRFANRLYQLEKPIYPGERGGKMIVEMRRDGTMKIRFGNQYLHYREIAARDPESLAHLRLTPEAEQKGTSRPWSRPRPLAYRRPTGARITLLRSPILPLARRSLAENHPWRKSRLKSK
jgi:hypothetical protein